MVACVRATATCHDQASDDRPPTTATCYEQAPFFWALCSPWGLPHKTHKGPVASVVSCRVDTGMRQLSFQLHAGGRHF